MSESSSVDEEEGDHLADLPVPKGPALAHQRPLGLAVGSADSGDVDLPVPKRAFESVSWREAPPPPEPPPVAPPVAPSSQAAPAEREAAATSGGAGAPSVPAGVPGEKGGGNGVAVASASARASGEAAQAPALPVAPPVETTAPATRLSVPQAAPAASGRRAWLVVGALGLVASAGAWFGLRSWLRPPAAATGAAPDPAALAKVRRLLAEASIPACREVVAELQNLPPADPQGDAARGLLAQAHLTLALLGPGKEAEALAVRQAQAVLASPGPGTQDARDSMEVRKARALELLFAEKLDEAAKILQALRDEAPRDPAVRVHLGWADLAIPDLKAAQAEFNQALALEPARADALLGLGQARGRLGDFQGARAAYQSVLRQHPHHPGAEIGLLSLSEPDPAPVARRLDALQARPGSADRPAALLSEAWAMVGRRALGEGRTDEAEGYFRRALQVDARSVEGTVGLAQALVQSGMMGAAQALPLLEGVLARRPRHLGAQLVLVEAAIRTGHLDAAQKALHQAAALAPDLPALRLWRGRLTELRKGPGADERAGRDYQAAIDGASHLTPAYLALAQLWRRMGRVAQGEALLAEIERRAAGDSALADELGRGYLMMGETRRAEALFRKASEGTPGRIGPRLHLAEALVLLQRLDEAVQVLDELGHTDPMLPGLAARRAELAMQRHRFDEAATHYAQALDSSLGAPSLSLRIAAGEIFLKVGKLEAARDAFQDALKDDEHSALAQLGLAQTDLALGRFADAIPEAQRAAALGAGPRAHLLAAQAGERLGHRDQALADYQAAMDASSIGIDARMGRARLQLRRGAAKESIADLSYVLKHEPQRIEAQLLLGDAYEALGQRSRAYAAYQLAVRRDVRNAEAAFKLGRLLKTEGKLKVAIPALERVIALDGERGPFSAEAYLLLGEAHRALVRPGKPGPDRALAIQAYRKYLELTPRIDAPMRRDAERALQLLEAPPP
ncbi:MAG TPA: tetratricopeptide repeat protein [Polyangia bacterium]|nr:tetratricopeptide repeat protein [Polyangia bacterium]